MNSIELTPEQIEKVIRQGLIQMYSTYSNNEVINSSDDDFLYCLQRVIEFYSSPADYEDWQESLSREHQ